MKKLLLLPLFSILLVTCQQEDPGTLQKDQKAWPIIGFDRLEVSDGFDVTIVQGSVFSVQASGDRRDIADLQIEKIGGSLSLKYDISKKRQYTTYFTITMPLINGMDCSGAVNVRASGFKDSTSRFDLSMTGRSLGQFDIHGQDIHLFLSGASQVSFTGGPGKTLEASISGSSQLLAFDYIVSDASLNLSGTSVANISAVSALNISATGGSQVLYKGNPIVENYIEDGSMVARQ